MPKQPLISYHTEYNMIWELLVSYDFVPTIFPPPLKVHMHGTPKTTEARDVLNGIGVDGYIGGKMNTIWSYATERDKPDKISFINPVDYNIEIFHYNTMALFGPKYDWGGKVTFGAYRFHVWHDIVHEFGHYVTNYKKWMMSHSDDYPEPHEDCVKMLFDHVKAAGQYDDERQNEKWTIETLGEIFDIDIDTMPVPGGAYAERFAKKYNNPLYSQQCACLQYYMSWYKLVYEKLSDDEVLRENRLVEESIEYIQSVYDPDEKIKWKT